MARFTTLLLVALPLTFLAGPGDANETPFVFTEDVSDLSIRASEVPGVWEGPTGIMFDDLSDLDNAPDALKPIGEKLYEQLTPIGITGCADFTYMNPTDLSRMVVVRVFVFDSEESCNAWWSKKYENEKSKPLYEPVGGVEYRAIDSIQMTKRIVSLGNLWITCHQLGDNDDHLKILAAYLDRIRGT